MTKLTREQLFEGMNYLRDDSDKYGRSPTREDLRIYHNLASVIWDKYFTEPEPSLAELSQKYKVHQQTIRNWLQRAGRILRHPDNQEHFTSLYPHWQETRLYRDVRGEEESR